MKNNIWIFFLVIIIGKYVLDFTDTALFFIALVSLIIVVYEEIKERLDRIEDKINNMIVIDNDLS